MNSGRKLTIIETTQWLKHGDHPSVVEVPQEHLKDLNLSTPSALGWVPTPEGGCIVTRGDWIITGVCAWDHRPCKPDVFVATNTAGEGAVNDAVPESTDEQFAQRGKTIQDLQNKLEAANTEIRTLRAMISAAGASEPAEVAQTTPMCPACESTNVFLSMRDKGLHWCGHCHNQWFVEAVQAAPNEGGHQ